MTQAAHDTMTLAGLAAANGPWLAVRLQRLAEHAGLPLARDVVEYAVVNTSRVLGEVLDAEGRPSPNVNIATDPVAALGREQAEAHKKAGLPMPDSLRVQRLLRRAYDDLVRESWVEKDSRARAHEDVERFFERALIGLVAAWTGQPVSAAPAPQPPLIDDTQAKLLARREDELRRAMEAAQKLTLALRQSRDRADALSTELAQVSGQAQGLGELKAQLVHAKGQLEQAQTELAQAQAQLKEQGDLKAQLAQIKEQAADNLNGLKGQLTQLKEQAAASLANLKAEFAQAHAQALAQAQAQDQAEQQALVAQVRDLEAERTALGARLADLEMALAAHGDAESAQLEAREELERARAEADRAREKAEQARNDLQQLREAAQDLRAHAERQAQGSRAEADALRAELQQLREAHATLSSEAEGMRTRLSETGSRLSELRRAEEEEIQNRLGQAADAMAQAQARIAEIEAERDALSAQLAEANARLRQSGSSQEELSAQTKDLAQRLKDAEGQVIDLSETLERTRAELSELKDAEARLREQAASQSQTLEAERLDLAQRLKDAEAQIIGLTETLARTQAELTNVQTSGGEASNQAQALAVERLELAGRLKEAETQIIDLTGKLNQARRELDSAQAGQGQAAEQAQSLEAERFDLAKRLKDAEGQVMSLSEALERSRIELDAAQANLEQNEGLRSQTQAMEAERFDLARRLKEAEAQVIQLSERLNQTTAAHASSEAQRQDAERRAADAVARAAEVLQESKTQTKARLDEMAALREVAARMLATHLTLTPDAVAALDASGAFSAWNKRFISQFGLSEDVLAAGIDAVLTRLASAIQRPEAFLARTRELLANPQLVEDGLTIATTRGETLVFRSAGVRSANHSVGRLLNFRDVSLERDMENLVREIESITRYELGQALTAFIHLPQALLDDPTTTPAQAQKLTVIRDSGYRIVNTVNMAVDIFRMERGLYQMRPGCTLDLAVVARRAVKDVNPLAASRHIDLELLLDQSPLPQDCVLPGPGDAILAHALAVNLLRDSLEAAPAKSGVCAVLHQDEAGLLFSITRQGALAVDEAASYFDKPIEQDAGYGLQRARYAAQLIARSLGGTLALTSTLQAGTTLALRLPKG